MKIRANKLENLQCKCEPLGGFKLFKFFVIKKFHQQKSERFC